MSHIVTKDSLQHMLDSDNKAYVQAVIGRALVVLLNRQTTAESSSNQSQIHNCQGFSRPDARSGSLTAKFYIKHGYLTDWMVTAWTRRGDNGYSRLTKYWKQLDHYAKSKQMRAS